MFKHPDAPDSRVARWDARWKLAALTVAAFGAAALTQPATVAVALVLGLALLALARLSAKWVRGRLALLGFAALPFLFVLPFTLDPSGNGWDVGPVRVSERGLIAGAVVFGRCLAVGCFALTVIGTAPPHRTLAAAHKLKVPGVLVLLTGLAYRYAFLLGDELRRVRVALRTRGFRMRPDRHGYHTTGNVVGAVLVRGADRADRVTEAMRCRGFDGTFHSAAAFRTTSADIISFVVVVAAVGALVLFDRLVLN